MERFNKMFLKKTAVNLNQKKKKTFKNKTINFNNLKNFKNCFRKYIKKILTKKSNNLTTWCFLMIEDIYTNNFFVSAI